MIKADIGRERDRQSEILRQTVRQSEIRIDSQTDWNCQSDSPRDQDRQPELKIETNRESRDWDRQSGRSG